MSRTSPSDRFAIDHPPDEPAMSLGRVDTVVVVGFLILVQATGALAGFWLPAIAPAIGADLGLSPALIGYQVLVQYVFGMLSSLMAGGFVQRLGAWRASQVALLLFVLAHALFLTGSVAMIAEGCIMARVCHTNNCPVGVATQKEALRQRFTGLPEHVVNFFLYVAEEVRQLLSVLGVARLEDLIGRNELLQRRQVKLEKTESLDLTTLLAPVAGTDNRSWLTHAADAHGNGAVLEDQLLADAELMAAIESHGTIQRSIEIVNTDRSVCARLAGEIAARHGNRGFNGQLQLHFQGAAGQSFGAFLVQGMDVRLQGEANDYIGKGMNSGRIVLVPNPGTASPGDQVILGNTCLYGATGGELLVHGRAGERFAVRNSGARTVVEGTGDHCCEYMTGGVVVVLGSTGRNVGAGMTGGVAFILDESGGLVDRVNHEIVEIRAVDTSEQEAVLKPLLEAHLASTGSEKAAAILSDWSSWKSRFKLLVPPSERAAMGLVDRTAVAA